MTKRRTNLALFVGMNGAALLGLALFSIAPFVFLVALSFSKSSLGNTFSQFVGWSNYHWAITGTGFSGSLLRTTLFAATVCCIQLVLGLLLALLFDRMSRGGGLVRTLTLLPLMTPPVMVGTAWKLILAPSGGFLNGWLLSNGWITEPISFLGNKDLAFWSIVVADTWQWTPFIAILCYSALKVLPQDIFEAAALDGAYPLRQFFTLTLPIIAPALAAVFLLKLIIAFKTFDLVFVLTFGGPGNSTNMTSFMIWKTALREFDVGLAAAMTLLFAIFVGLVTLPITWGYKRLSAALGQ